MKALIKAVKQPQTLTTTLRESDACKTFSGDESQEKIEIENGSGDPKVVEKKKKKKPVYPQEDEYTLVAIDQPKKVKLAKCNKKACIKFYYTLNSDPESIRHDKSVRFGIKGVDDYVDHKDEAKKQQTISKLKNIDNIFKASFWRLIILNGRSSDVYENYLIAQRTLGVCEFE